jgi:Restriction endonuclease
MGATHARHGGLVPVPPEGEHAAVSLFVIIAVAAAVGFVLILVIGRGQPVSPAASTSVAAEERADLSWIRSHGVEGLERLLQRLFEEMGFEPGPAERTAASVAFWATDPRPIRGGRIYVHGVLARPGTRVDGDEVRALVDAARGEAAGKAVLVTLGGFSEDAREAARDQPMELVDGDAFADLVKKHLPQVHATRTV